MTDTDTTDAAERLEQLEAIIARSEAERQAAATVRDRIENQRNQSLAELSKDAQRRQAEAIADRRREQEERSRRYDAHLARVQPAVDRLKAEAATVDAAVHAERARSSAALSPLFHRKTEIAHEINALTSQPPDDAAPPPATPRERIRALVGRAA
jgi:hypothetical protein